MDKVKTLFTALFGALSAWLGILAVPMYVLVGLNVCDYFTGIAASRRRGEAVSSSVGLAGIVKKVCMWLLVALGAVIDWLLMFAAGQIGIDMHVQFLVACVVAVWLICNEIISILENVADIGVALPPFLLRLVKELKAKAEEAGDAVELEQK